MRGGRGVGANKSTNVANIQSYVVTVHIKCVVTDINQGSNASQFVVREGWFCHGLAGQFFSNHLLNPPFIMRG